MRFVCLVADSKAVEPRADQGLIGENADLVSKFPSTGCSAIRKLTLVSLVGMKMAAAQQKESLGASTDKAVIDACKAFKEAGFKPKLVMRNLPPSHLYEKVRTRHNSKRAPWLCDSYYGTRNCAILAWPRLAVTQTAASSRENYDAVSRRSGSMLSGCNAVLCLGDTTDNPSAPVSQWLPCVLLLQALRYEPGTHIVKSGALATSSGKQCAVCAAWIAPKLAHAAHVICCAVLA
jgi:hypothetical protein